MSLRAYHAPTHPRPVPIYLPPGAAPGSLADEVDLLRSILPPYVADGDLFACWRYVWDAGRGGWGKVPLDPCSPGRYARTNDRRTCGTLRDAVGFRRQHAADGISRLLVDTGEVLGIDLDAVRDPVSGALAPLARLTLEQLPEAYAELSPSARGVRLFLQAAFPEPGRRGRKRGQVEVYGANRFLSITGRTLGRPTGGAAGDVTAWYRGQFPPPLPVAIPGGVRDRRLPLSDRELLERAFAARNGHTFSRLWRGDTSGYDHDHSRADAALVAHLWWWTGGDPLRVDALFRRSALFRPDKWDRRHYGDGRTYGQALIDHMWVLGAAR